jgi:two-component system sensor histidine kinase AlgZ
VKYRRKVVKSKARAFFSSYSRQSGQRGIAEEAHFLPDFCSAPIVFKAILLGLAITGIFILSTLGTYQQSWENWSLISWFVLWVVMSSMLLLCLGRRWLKRLSPTFAAFFSIVIILAVTWGLSEFAWFQVLQPVQFEQQEFEHYRFVLRNLGISTILGIIVLHYLYLSYHREQQAVLSLQARLQALQSRMQPHFLFNAMNTIASLTRVDPGKAETAIEDLSDLLRAALADASERITLAQELALCRSYLDLELQRLGARLDIEWMVDLLPQDALIPTFALQTLLENAIRHGIQTQAEGGIVHVSGLCDGRYIQIEVENPLPAAARSGHRIALRNLQERLHAYYERKGYVEIEQTNTFKVKMRFPYVPEPTAR